MDEEYFTCSDSIGKVIVVWVVISLDSACFEAAPGVGGVKYDQVVGNAVSFFPLSSRLNLGSQRRKIFQEMTSTQPLCTIMEVGVDLSAVPI